MKADSETGIWKIFVVTWMICAHALVMEVVVVDHPCAAMHTHESSFVLCANDVEFEKHGVHALKFVSDLYVPGGHT